MEIESDQNGNIDISDKEKSRICLSCMKCCKKVYFRLHPTDYSGIQFYITRGLDVRFFESYVYIVVDQTCQHLTDKGCDIYETRPYSCKIFDGRLDPILPDLCEWPRVIKP